jgi:hypothetical protein
MADAPCEPVAVSRRIEAPAGEIFALLADPARHPDIDGSGMLRPGAPVAVVAGTGDVFTMKMHHQGLGDYEMINHVVTYEQDRAIAWEPAMGAHNRGDDAAFPIGTRPGQRWGFELVPDGSDATIVTETYDCSRAPAMVRELVDDGRGWIDSMHQTLERIETLCAGPVGGS